MTTLEIEVVTRDTLQAVLGMERAFMERHAKPVGDIPAMPRLVIGQRGTKYHL